jgi:hypothetical protein
MWKPCIGLVLMLPATLSLADNSTVCPTDSAVVAGLDTQYQAAVEKSDAAAMDRLLADDFTLVKGNGSVLHKTDLLAQAHDPKLKYTRQSDIQQTVRFWNGTAVVTALLLIEGVNGDKRMDYTLWFSDVYVCTPKGWRYAFGQAGTLMPKTP